MIVNKKVLRELLDKVAGDNDCFFYAIATEDMKNHIMKNDDHVLSKMPQGFRAILLAGKGIALDNGLLVKFAAGEADADTTHVLNMCNIMLNAPLSIKA